MFDHHMENNYQGDLADVVRARGNKGHHHVGSFGDISPPIWQFPSTFPFAGSEDFCDPLLPSDSRNPLLHELDITGGSLFKTPFCVDRIKDGVFGVGESVGMDLEKEDINRPCGIFSRMLQISSDTQLSPSSMAGTVARAQSESAEIGGAVANSRTCFSDHIGMQISSPRSSGTKRRKSQVKKVVCIPAPAPASSRPSSGEVVPSDLWAWRKYGQKPIKGSPYPRGYYRCSSSKGCSARKQVERSRSDPNMLVITYTSEHNHPWPTQRNALAGSTRSQPPNNGGGCKSPPPLESQKSLPNHTDCFNNASPFLMIGSPSPSSTSKDEETTRTTLNTAPMEMEDGEFEQTEDFFADLDEIETDPLSGLIFSNGFADVDQEDRGKTLDPFGIFDWTVGTSSFGEAKRGL